MLTIIESSPTADTTAPEPVFRIRSHNTVTAFNPATGQHRTFRIRTQPNDADFMPRMRIISLLTGPNNERDFTSFGFVGGDGSIHVWQKKRGTQFEKLARFLERADWFAANQGFTFTWSANDGWYLCSGMETDQAFAAAVGTTRIDRPSLSRIRHALFESNSACRWNRGGVFFSLAYPGTHNAC